MHAQPLIAVRDVQASSGWYQALLGCESGHGGTGYEQIVFEGQMVLQLHAWEVHEHPYMGNPDSKPYGNGVLLWFQTDNFDAVVEQAYALRAVVLEGPRVNSDANHREIWLRDLDGYVVVVAGPYGDLGAPPSN
jgi:catechol 2,3-dioxygenase-like lactoylglutathione lyase family enzyme